MALIDRLNPLIALGIRQRLRRRSLISSGLVTLTITSFVYLIIFLTPTERGMMDTATAAKAAFIPILIIQGFILMLLGTGSVASGVVQERESGRLDYHRMTPMSAFAKIIGYLYGLPAREYYMFSLTVPFMLFSVIAGGIPVSSVLHFYFVFFISVMLYHMTGMVAGMVAKKPRRAGWFARGMVILLYIFLPGLAQLGFSFLGYFTVLPTFWGLVHQDLVTVNSIGSAVILKNAEIWRAVPFFTVSLNPALYTFLMQGSLLSLFFSIVYRKWHRETNHAISKVAAATFFTAFQVLAVGSLWPLFSGGRVGTFSLLAGATSANQTLAKFVLVMMLYLLVSLALIFLLVHIITADRHQARKGVRRTRKLSLPRIPFGSDAASGFWVAAVFVITSLVGYLILFHVAGATPHFLRARPSFLAQLLPMAIFAPLVLYMQGLRESWGSRGYFAVLAIVWVIPTMVAMILLAAWSAVLPAMYCASVTPLAGLVYAFGQVFAGDLRGIKGNADTHLSTVLAIGIAFNTALAAWFAYRTRAVRKALHDEVAAEAPTMLPGSR